jgi:Na+-driven multidrug efflux pump
MVPLCYVLAFNFHLGLKGIWIGFIIGLTIAAILQIGRFKLKVKSIEFKEL